MKTATLAQYNLMTSIDMCSGSAKGQQNDALLLDGEDKFLFWKMAKKLCSEKKRAQRDAAMKAYRQSLEPVIIPTDIVLGADCDRSIASSTKGGDERPMVDLVNLLLPTAAAPPRSARDSIHESKSSASPYGTLDLDSLDEDDNDDNHSCVSDISRELPDIDAPSLYPNLEDLDQEDEIVGPADDSEKKDWRAEEMYSECSTSKDPEVDEFAEAMKALTMCKPSKGCLDSDSVSSSLSRDAKLSAQMKHMNLNLPPPIRRTKGSHGSLARSAHTLLSKDDIIEEGVPRDNFVYPITMAFSNTSQLATAPSFRRNISESSPVIPKRRGSLGSTASNEQSVDRRKSEHMPAPPQRKLSLDSQTSGNDLRFESERQWSTRRTGRGGPDIPEWKRAKSSESPAAPQRRRSNDSRTSTTDDLTPTRAELGYDADACPPQHPRRSEHSKDTPSFAGCSFDSKNQRQKYSQPLSLPQRRTTQPSREELGYDIAESDQVRELPKYATWHNSFSSYDTDDNSTIATWTLGLYKRRKSLDSTVAPPTAPTWTTPDTTPSRPKRRFSAGSVVREEIEAVKSRWHCLSSSPKPNKSKEDGSGRTPPTANQSGTNMTSDHSRQKKDQTKEVEIQPGLFLPLRDSQETAEAVQRNFVERTSCMSCATKLLCIADAEYVLCPQCSTVSPVLANLGCANGGGVGLGFESDETSVASSRLSITRLTTSPRIRS